MKWNLENSDNGEVFRVMEVGDGVPVDIFGYSVLTQSLGCSCRIDVKHPQRSRKADRTAIKIKLSWS